MASSKRIGFFWGEEKITVVEFEKNAPMQVVSSPLGAKVNASSPFSSNLTEEIQITAILQKMLQDSRISGGSFYVSLPMKEIILRSFIIPFVKADEIQNAIKFEAKKYVPFDIGDLSFVYYTIPFAEDQTKRLQVIFFAARKEVLARYERIFKSVNAEVVYCEPYMVSLVKTLLFRKEIKPTDQLAFLILDKNLGRICFIDQGIPQFIREFPINSPAQSDETDDSVEAMNLKIINEVGNSFDFYARQFGGERIDQMLVSSEFVQKNLLSSLETELKIKLIKFSPVLNTGGIGSNNDMDAIYAMGACVTPPIDSLAEFNFLGIQKPKSRLKSNALILFNSYKEIILVFVVCAIVLISSYTFFQVQLTATQTQYNQLSLKQGIYANEPLDNILNELQLNIEKLNNYKRVRLTSDISMIILKVASHLPKGALLNSLSVSYDEGDAKNVHLSIDMKGDVFKEDPNEEIAVVNQAFSDFKNDKELSKFIRSVNLVSLNREEFNGRKVTGFTIHCS